MYYTISMSVPSQHTESTDFLVYVHVYMDMYIVYVDMCCMCHEKVIVPFVFLQKGKKMV